MKFEGLIKVADKIDALGFHEEANLLDRIMLKRADLLGLREKPALARLAKILLIVRKYNSGERAREEARLPMTGVPIIGMTKQEVVSGVQKNLIEIINQIMVPIFEDEYRGTKFEKGYRIFINKTMEVNKMLQGLFATQSEQQSISKALDALSTSKKAFQDMLVSIRSRDLSEEDVPPETSEAMEEEILEMMEALSDVGISIKEHDTEQAYRKMKKFEDSIPQEANPDSPLFMLVFRMFQEKALAPFRQVIEKVENQVNSKIDSREIERLEEIKENLPGVKKNYMSDKNILRRIDLLHKNLLTLEKDIKQKSEIPKVVETVETDQSEWAAGIKRKELGEFNANEAFIKALPSQYTLPTGGMGYAESATHERYNRLEAEVNNLQNWFASYLAAKGGSISTTHSFSNYMSKKTNPNIAQEALDILKEGIVMFRKNMQSSSQSKKKEIDEQEVESNIINEKKDIIRNQVVWGIWYRDYITSMANTVFLYLSPETSSGSGESFTQSYNNVLRAFNGLLSYEL